ncbi:MAG: HAMP domain-containing protein [Syntrophales bacterium]|nr:HAMP domain-containing protein [Syntrophales bacterium]
MIFTSGFAIYELYDLKKRADHIVSNYFEMVENAKSMMGVLLGMEELAKKYIVLREPEMASLYWTRSQEVNLFLSRLQHSKVVRKGEVAILREKKEDYDRLFLRVVDNVEEFKNIDNRAAFLRETDTLMHEMNHVLNILIQRGEGEIDRGMKEINRKSLNAMQITALLAGFSLVCGFTLAIVFIIHISGPVMRLKDAAVKIGEGNFDVRVKVEREDEIGLLASAFNYMAGRLKELEALYLDASPLTGLPGNLAIEREIERRLKQGITFSLCHVDLDHFKPYADVYGYAWGSEFIKETAKLLEEARKKGGNNEDFIGHIGGDDFVIIGNPDRVKLMSEYIVKHFTDRTAHLYLAEDKMRGHIWAPDRKGEMQRFPLITITLSIVTDDGSLYRNAVEMARAAAEVKAVGKTIPGNKFLTQEDVKRCK